MAEASSRYPIGGRSRRLRRRLGAVLAAAAIALLSLPAAAAADSNGKVVVGAAATIEPGTALIRVFCNGPLSCKGTLRLLATVGAGNGGRSVTLGRSSFRLAAGSSRVLRLPLGTRAMRLLRSGRPLRARAAGTGLHPHAVKLKRAARFRKI